MEYLKLLWEKSFFHFKFHSSLLVPFYPLSRRLPSISRKIVRYPKFSWLERGGEGKGKVKLRRAGQDKGGDGRERRARSLASLATRRGARVSALLLSSVHRKHRRRKKDIAVKRRNRKRGGVRRLGRRLARFTGLNRGLFHVLTRRKPWNIKRAITRPIHRDATLRHASVTHGATETAMDDR